MKRAGAGSRSSQQPEDVGKRVGQPGVAVQKGGERYELVAETRVAPLPKLCTLAGTVMRCLSTIRGESFLTEVDAASGCTVRRIAGLPLLHRLWSNSSGYSLGYTQTKPSATRRSYSSCILMGRCCANEFCQMQPPTSSRAMECGRPDAGTIGCTDIRSTASGCGNGGCRWTGGGIGTVPDGTG